ncbi:cytochrome c oxidase subunit II [Saliniramus sp.]|uniref:cytochrome c oxidase subunit II n=1 Tax=Saliniramus sp. TaxID=2986772 RepID=UPI0039C94DAA
MEQTGSRETRLRRAMSRLLAGAAVGMAALAAAVPAAADVINQPQPWQMGMMPPQSDVAQSMVSFHNGLLWVITLITIFVGALLLICIFRFNEKKNPNPSRTSHNTMLEVAWTVIPILILVAIAVPSFRLLRDQLIIPEPDVVVKATGHSWYWEYEYPEDQGGFSFISAMLEREDAEASGQPYLLAVDNAMVVPVGANVAVQVTAQGVLHSFAMPSFGIKTDAVPGRLNETWFRAEREGIYYGQCSELCGSGHAFMPIAVRVVSEEAYAEWLDEARAMFASVDDERRVASSD